MQISPRTKRGLGRLGKLLGVIVVGTIVFTLLTVALAPVATQVKASGEFWLDEKADPLELPPLSEPSYVYSATGQFLARFKAEVDREPVTLEQVPVGVRQAFMASEDDTFYEHMGIDAKSIGRALLSNFESGGISQGGSTITQQVIKNAYFIEQDSGIAKQTLDRKVREAFMAVRLERHMSKDQILERYLNTVYIGGGAYGIQAAARRYFSKSVGELQVWEAALLAGMVSSPSRFDPVIHPEAALERRNWVLGRLLELGWIDQAGYDLGLAQPLPTQRFDMADNTESLYFVEAVKQELLNGNIIPVSTQDPIQAKVERRNAVFKGGLRITTTLDPPLQHLAEMTVRDAIDGRRYSAALVAIDPNTGAVRAVFGGEDFQQEQFNLAMQGRRNAGSTMKVFAVVALLERGYSPNDNWGAPNSCIYKQADGRPWPGKNSVTGGGGGTYSLRQNLAGSYNCAFVNIVNRIRPEAIVDTSDKLGVSRDKLSNVPAIVLGGSSVSPLDMAAGFATIASGGVKHNVHLIETVVNARKEPVYQAAPVSEQVLDPNIAYATIDMMKDVLTSGTARGNGIGRPAAGKTGTTDNKADSWFVGMTPQLVTAIWTGNPDRVEPGVTGGGGNTAAPIWQAFMGPAHEGLPELDWPQADYSVFRGGRTFDGVGGGSSGSSRRPSGGGDPGVVDTGGGQPRDLGGRGGAGGGTGGAGGGGEGGGGEGGAGGGEGGGGHVPPATE